ncbi:hypothetical protein [Cesiribacter sp. SM1]|uniref:hypothetical protein n=1 Tax=Cesiribacter sp. SM1 TaxID=2861196 RepID=UPI001CD43F90|nr:hypothetical protein [Cesiribacter sp. SM1]
MKHPLYYFLLLLCLVPQFVKAQQSVSPGQEKAAFKNGLYLTYADFVTNKPSVALEAIENLESFVDLHKGSERIEAPKLIYFMVNDEMKSVASNEIWGLCAFNTPYVFDEKNFYKLEILGAIMKFNNTDHKLWNEKPGLPGQKVTTITVPKYIVFRSGEIISEKQQVEQAFSADPEFFNEYKNSLNSDSSPTLESHIVSFNKRNPVQIPAEL